MLLVCCAAQGKASDAVLPIGLQKQLLVDGYAIAESSDVERVLGPITKANGGRPVMVADKKIALNSSGNVACVCARCCGRKPNSTMRPGLTQPRMAAALGVGQRSRSKP